MSTSYMNYAEKLNLSMSPQPPSNPGTPSTPTTAAQSFAPPQSPYKAYSLYSPSPPPYSSQSPQPFAPYGDPAQDNKKVDAQQYAPYAPPTPIYEKSSVPLDNSSNASYLSPVSPNNQSCAQNSSSTATSPRQDVQKCAPYVPPASVKSVSPSPPASQPSAPRSSPSSANDWPSNSSVPPAPVTTRTNVQPYATSVSSTPLYGNSSFLSTSPASASYATSAPASSQSYAAHVLPSSTNSPSSSSYIARNSVYGNPPFSTPSPLNTHNVPPTAVNEKPPEPPTSQPNASYDTSSFGGSQSYATRATSASAYNQPNTPYTATSPAHDKTLNPTTPQSLSLSIPSALTSNRPSIKSPSSAPVINQPNVSYLASSPIHDKPPIPSTSSSSTPNLPPTPPTNIQPGSSDAGTTQAQKSHPISFTNLPGTQKGPPAPANIQLNATSRISVPASSNQPNLSYEGPMLFDNKITLLPPPPSAVPPPPAYNKAHDGYFASRPALAQILTPPTTKHDPSPMNQPFEPAAQTIQGLASPTSPFPYTPSLTPTSGTEPAIPVYNPQSMNQAYVPVAPSPSLTSSPVVQCLYTPESTPTGASIPQFPLPPGAAAGADGETKSSWGKRFVGNMLITRGIRAGVTSVTSSVKLPAMLSPWGDNNPVTLPNVRRRDMVPLAGSYFGADAIISGSVTFAGGLLVDAMRCVSEQVVDQAILDRIRFNEAQILRTTSVKSLQITIKHQLMGVDADLRFFGERSAPLTMLSCAKGWFCPYLYASGRTPSVPRSQNFAVAQCFGPFLNADSALAHRVLAEGVATMSLCDPDPAHTPVNGHHRLIVFFAGISPWRTQAWSQARIPGQAKLILHLINGCPALVIPVNAGGTAQGQGHQRLQGEQGQGAPICAWSTWTLAQMTSNMDYAPERHYEELFRFLESMMSVPNVEAGKNAAAGRGWRDALARGLQMMIKGAVATREIVDPKVVGMIDPERAGIVMFRY